MAIQLVAHLSNRYYKTLDHIHNEQVIVSRADYKLITSLKIWCDTNDLESVVLTEISATQYDITKLLSKYPCKQFWHILLLHNDDPVDCWLYNNAAIELLFDSIHNELRYERIKNNINSSINFDLVYNNEIIKENINSLDMGVKEFSYKVFPINHQLKIELKCKNENQANLYDTYWLVTIKEYGVTLWDKNQGYVYGYLNYEKSTPTLNTTSTIVQTLNSKTPFIVNNIEQEYYTGTISATFVEENENMNWGYDFTNAVQYRISFKEWLYNGQPKILTFINGNKYIISISGNISDNLEGDFDNIITTFNWYEIAEYNQDNLYEYGFTGNISDWYNLEPMTDDSLSKIQLEKLIKYVPKNESDVINFNDNQIDILRDYAFANSPIITTVEMTALESIGNYAFSGCNMLQEAIFSKVTVINRDAFNGCSNLYNLIIKTNSVCSLGTNALLNTPISNASVSNAYLYVPNDLKNSYATNWGIDIAKIRSIEGSEYDG